MSTTTEQRCQACDRPIEIRYSDYPASHVVQFQCGSYTIGDSPPVRSKTCLSIENARLRRFVEQVRLADRLMSVTAEAERIRSIIVEFDEGER